MEEKKRIILVEDDTVLREVLAEKLEKSGYIVDRAEDGVVALEKMHIARPDCALLDILMPRKGGIQVLEEMRADANLRDVSVIIISNSGQPVEIGRAKELGAKDFLIKAVFDPNEVLKKVQRVLADDSVSMNSAGWSVQTQGVSGFGAVSESPSVQVEEKDKDAVASPAAQTEAKKFVLVIEDDKFLRELLVRKLSSEGFDVLNAIDADAAFAILSERKPNVILCDLILPGVDGFEILKRIKADPKISDVPVVILSNLGQKDDLDKAMGLGAKDFMVKANFTLDEIVTKVRSIV